MKGKVENDIINPEDIINGFKYEAWIGYEWIEVEYPKTGFTTKRAIVKLSKEGKARRIKNSNSKPHPMTPQEQATKQINMKKNILFFASALILLISSCQSQPKYTATVYGLDTRIAVPDNHRDIGYDSIQLIVRDGKIKANFCYPNGLRFKKDTIFTDDMKYRLWGFKFKITDDIYITTKDTKLTMVVRDGYFINGICDSVIIDDYKITVTKIKL